MSDGIQHLAIPGGGRFLLAPCRAAVLRASVVCALLVHAGCGPDSPEERGRRSAVSETATSGPVEVTLSAWPGAVTVDERAHIELEVIADKGVTLLDHDYEAILRGEGHLYEFRIAGAESESAVVTRGGRLRWAQRVELEFFVPGEHELPGAEVSYVDMTEEEGGVGRASTWGSEEPRQFSTESLRVVVSAAEGLELTEAELRTVPRLDPIELSASRRLWWWVIPFSLVAVLAMAILLMKRRRGVVFESAASVPAHEWARARLAELVAEDLIGKGRVQEFYYRVSGILRGYLERRFGVSAPDMTTEEFLASTARDRRFRAEIRKELNLFLTACDMVKYACHAPQDEEAAGAIHAARDFVERTQAPGSVESEDGAPAGERAA